MTILHITESLGGGVYSYFKDMEYYISNHLKDAQIKHVLIYSPNRKEFDKETIKNQLSKSFELIEVPMGREINPLHDLKSLVKLSHKIFQIKPDIIHLHSSKAGVIGRIAAISATNSKLFYTPHGFSFIRKDISSLKRKFYFIVEKLISMSFGGTIIACGDTEYELSKKINSKAILIRNGINLKEIPKISKEKNDSILIGILGRITEARNPNLFNEIASEFPNIKFKWIGDGHLRSTLKEPNIEITGWFNNREEGIIELNTLDIYIQTSLWEGLPFSILEAMASKKPVIASNIIGNKDIVLHSKTGYLYDSKADLKKYIEILISKDSLRKTFGETGYKRVEEVFNSEKNFRLLYKEVYLPMNI